MATNSSILDRIRTNGTNDYQQRIPAASQAGIKATLAALQKPGNGRLYNEFVEGLVTLIGTQYINSKQWTNPFNEFKRLNIANAQIVQEIGFQLMAAKGFDSESQELFLSENPEIKVAYHSMNRQDKYKVTINQSMLQNAFLTPNGLSDFIAGVMTAQLNSDAIDEYNIIKNLITEADAADSFYNVSIADLTSDTATEAEVKGFIEKVRAMTGQLKFLSTQYNKYGIPTFTTPENLVLFITPELNAKIDVNVLAAAFNVSYADMTARIVIIDKFPVANIQALLVDEDWFKVGDILFENRSFENPETLSTQFYLHHWQTISYSPFMNAIKFTTEADTEIPVVDTTPAATLGLTCQMVGSTTSITTINLEDEFEFVPSLVMTNSPDNVHLIDNFRAAVIEVMSITRADGSDADLDPDVVQLEPTTYVDRLYRLHLQEDVQSGDTITVMATTTYVKDDGTTIATPTKTLDLTVV